MKVKFFLIVAVSIILTSCAGYHFNTNSNPLISYDIKTLSVPMFINRTVLPDLAAPLTKEIIFVLNDYPGLKVVSGHDQSADAFLVGVIESGDHINDVVQSSQYLFTNTTLKESIGNRTDFYYPIQTSYNLVLRIYLIKNPTSEDLQLLTGELRNLAKFNSKVILSDTIALTGTFSRFVGQTNALNSAGKNNFVKNKGFFEKSIRETAVNAAKSFRQVVLNAF